MKYPLSLLITLLLINGHVVAGDGKSSSNPAPKSENERSPARNISPPPDRQTHDRALPVPMSDVRSADGSGNNELHVFRGAALTPLARSLPADYSDGVASLAGEFRPSARFISNIVSVQTEQITNREGATDFLWQWGQFLDHDIDLTDGADPVEPAPIDIPADDVFFFAGATMSLNRSAFAPGTGITTPRQQLNEVTAWIDASNVYGSSEERQLALREAGSARLKTSPGDFLPFNEAGLSNAGGDSPDLFLAGDVRANEQAGLIAMHTLFVREHNRLVTRIEQQFPAWTDDEVFEKARQLVGAQMQFITYREFLPALIGDRVAGYRGYDADVDASIANVFSTAAYRFGHSALSSSLQRLNADGSDYGDGALALRDAFFEPSLVTEPGSLEALLRGLAGQVCSQVDVMVTDDVRNFLFGAPPNAGFDLAALNIQRGRDHGLPSYVQARRELGLPPITEFEEISSDPLIVDRLANAYLSVDDVDLWVGGLAEDHLQDSHLGELFTMIVVRQFEALRDGDRFWYRRVLSRDELRYIERSRLADIIRRNTEIGDELSDDVFHVGSKADAKRRRDGRS